MLMSLLLSKDERSALSLLEPLLKQFGDKLGGGDFPLGEVIDQLRGARPAEGAVADLVSLVRRINHVPALKEAAVTTVLSFAEKRGVAPATVASLLRKVSTFAKIELTDPTNPATVVSDVMESLGSRQTARDGRIGAICICPSCEFTFFV